MCLRFNAFVVSIFSWQDRLCSSPEVLERRNLVRIALTVSTLMGFHRGRPSAGVWTIRRPLFLFSIVSILSGFRDWRHYSISHHILLIFILFSFNNGFVGSDFRKKNNTAMITIFDSSNNLSSISIEFHFFFVILNCWSQKAARFDWNQFVAVGGHTCNLVPYSHSTLIGRVLHWSEPRNLFDELKGQRCWQMQAAYCLFQMTFSSPSLPPRCIFFCNCYDFLLINYYLLFNRIHYYLSFFHFFLIFFNQWFNFIVPKNWL